MNTGAVAVGVSAGGFHAFHTVLAPLPSDFALPIAVVQHQHADADDYLVRSLCEKCHLAAWHPENGEEPRPGVIYIAPPTRHLLFTDGPGFVLSDDAPVNYSRPSIDVLFLSSAAVYGVHAIGVVLTGANHDGAEGLREIKAQSGLTIVQDPETAESRVMPEAAIAATPIDHVVRLDQTGPVLWDVERTRRSCLIRKDM